MTVSPTFIASAVTAAPVIGAAVALDPNIIIASAIAALPGLMGVMLLYLQGRKIAKSVDGVVSTLVKAESGKAKAEAIVEERMKEDARSADLAALAVIERDKDRAATVVPSPVKLAKGAGVDTPLVVTSK